MPYPKILIADDDALVRDAVVKILELFGYQITAVPGGREALEILSDEYDAIILDINMPGMNGFETIQAITKRGLDIPVLFLTGAGTMEYAVKAISLGAYDFIAKPIDDIDLFEVKIKRAIEKRMFLIKEKSYKKNLEKEVKLKTKELAEKNILLEQYSHHLEVSTVNTIITLNTALEEKDQYTAGHTRRVTEYSQMICRAMDLSQAEISVVTRACQLHDIGKLVIDVSCIQKPGPLTDEEWTLVKKHPEVGENIIRPLSFLSREGTIVRHHHERLDGKGYPDGIYGDDIDLLTKIVTVADSYDAMTSKRAYKVNMAKEDAIEEMRKHCNTQFDPRVVETFIDILATRA
ncbi:MAG: response regulator [Desulfobulbaceae bacterium]|uniref:Response regulator n=1 Tax=Candidatus Desulfobia pelagia TaxID=2841692 RepID=A0A8J6NGS2_9BACT|nr:response regulator [Candidatus Desulfobia pelagia]